jgi:hypothetical protein
MGTKVYLTSLITFSFILLFSGLAYATDCDNLIPLNLSSNYNHLPTGNFSVDIDNCTVQAPNGAIVMADCLNPTPEFSYRYIQNYTIPIDYLNATKIYVVYHVGFSGCQDMPYTHVNWQNSYENEVVGSVSVVYSDGSSTYLPIKWRTNIDDWSFCRDLPEAIKIVKPEACYYLISMDTKSIPIVSIGLQNMQSVYSPGEMEITFWPIVVLKSEESCNDKILELEYRISDLESRVDEVNATCQDTSARVGLLESAVSSLSQTVQAIQNNLNNFISKITGYLSFLSKDLREDMLCGYLRQNNQKSIRDLGLYCEIKYGKCSCRFSA